MNVGHDELSHSNTCALPVLGIYHDQLIAYAHCLLPGARELSESCVHQYCGNLETEQPCVTLAPGGGSGVTTPEKFLQLMGKSALRIL